MSELFDRWWVARTGAPPDTAEERKTYHRLHAAWTAIASIEPVDALELVGLRLPQVVVQIYHCPDCREVVKVRTAPVLVPVDQAPDGTPLLAVRYPPTVLICTRCEAMLMEDELEEPLIEWHEKAIAEDLKP